MTSRDPANLNIHKRNYPSLKDVPDDEFYYVDGKWMISTKGVRLLAFLHKRLDVLDLINKAEEELKNEPNKKL